MRIKASKNHFNTMSQRNQERVIEGAARYAEADPSDPFAHARALSHARSGVGGVDQDGNPLYDATIEHVPVKDDDDNVVRDSEGDVLTAKKISNVKRA